MIWKWNGYNNDIWLGKASVIVLKPSPLVKTLEPYSEYANFSTLPMHSDHAITIDTIGPAVLRVIVGMQAFKSLTLITNQKLLIAGLASSKFEAQNLVEIDHCPKTRMRI